MCKRIIALILSFVIVFSSVVTVSFATIGDAGEYVVTNFWKMLTFQGGDGDAFSWLKGFISAFLAPEVTPETATESDWQDAYGRYTINIQNNFGSSVITSDGCLYLAVPHSYLSFSRSSPRIYLRCSHHPDGPYSNDEVGTLTADCAASRSSLSFVFQWPSYGARSGSVTYAFEYPIDGYYTVIGCTGTRTYLTSPTAAPIVSMYSFGGSGVSEFHEAGTPYSSTCSLFNVTQPAGCIATVQLSDYILKVLPASGALDVQGEGEVGRDSRPGSLTGITYGYQNDTGEIIVYVAKDSGMFNEEGVYLYNPITGKTLQADSWYYDYENRRYDIALANNQGRATLEYGDDGARITIIDSGNVTNVYNYYYMTPKDEPVDPPPVDPTPTPTPRPCTHSYTSAVTELPTCLIPGVRSYICMLCGDTYTEPVAAIGHIWVVRETVNASYDDNGNLLQAGYTIYKCSKCGTEHKDTADVGPPGNGGGGGGSGGFPGDTDLPDIPGSSDEEDGFNIFDIVGSIVNALWSLISGLFSTIFGGVVGFFTSLGSGISGFFSAFSGQDGVFGFATYGGADIWD